MILRKFRVSILVKDSFYFPHRCLSKLASISCIIIIMEKETNKQHPCIYIIIFSTRTFNLVIFIICICSWQTSLSFPIGKTPSSFSSSSNILEAVEEPRGKTTFTHAYNVENEPLIKCLSYIPYAFSHLQSHAVDLRI